MDGDFQMNGSDFYLTLRRSLKKLRLTRGEAGGVCGANAEGFCAERRKFLHIVCLCRQTCGYFEVTPAARGFRWPFPVESDKMEPEWYGGMGMAGMDWETGRMEAEAFFAGKPEELALFGHFDNWIRAHFPDAELVVQKSQLSYREGRAYCYLSEPRRRIAGRPGHYLIVTFGLRERVEHPRIVQSVEPYPGRWTHHLLISDPAELDGELLGWLTWAREVAVNPPPRRKRL